MRVLAVGPERRVDRLQRRRHPAAGRALDEGPQVLVLHEEGHELLGALLVLAFSEDHRGLDGGEVGHLAAVRLEREFGGADVVLVILLGRGALLGGERRVVHVVHVLAGDRDRGVMRGDGGAVVEGDVVVGVQPVHRGRRRAAALEDVGVGLHRLDHRLLVLGLVEHDLAVLVDDLGVIGVGEGQERIEGVGCCDAHRVADAVDALALGAHRALDLVAPEVPIAVPGLRDVGFLEARLLQHVLPVGDVHHLLLDREGIV